MRLSDLLAGVEIAECHASPDVEITGISYDTRTLKTGELFCALPGYKSDGQDFVSRALELGAAAVLCKVKPLEAESPWILSDNPRRALAQLSANWFGRPGDGMKLLGVTGTNGKTTTTHLLKSVLEQSLGAKVGLVGTNHNLIGEEIFPAHRTTPESYELQELLRRMADSGCTHVVMEVSSHALVLERVHGLTFEAGMFTNLTRDHLDFHNTMEEYRLAKSLLFAQAKLAVLNLDDEAGRYYREIVQCPVITYSERRDEADLTAKNIRLFPERVEFEAVMKDAIARVRLPIPGGFTIYNALCVVACAVGLGISLPEVARELANAKGVKGRIEVVPVPAEYTVLIDYAHSPDALENILTTVRAFAKKRVIVVFGCGGDRDRTKRPLMGEIAGFLADVAVVTSDNPRTEPPDAIIEDVLRGMETADADCVVEPDRRAAIRCALAQAQPGDVVVLAGKGHETYQEINGAFFHLDEREEVAAYFASMAN
ncbi:MAG: UDP-N-acetylmuramoylalanyl-D-glutamate--2,6-diaminopimelate ligase [Oscillospiraceae bacterium]|nr:UDP-N-acetylmuramoylalanyl-D-glutamate--2,6-diaminopimelate ligase [Oscillospiraceae bacterium]